MSILVGTPHFTRTEYEASAAARELGIDNRVPAHLEAAAQHVLEQLEVLRVELGCPLLITSGYRCPRVNMHVGGAPKSQHMRAEAADVWTPHRTRGQILLAVARLHSAGWAWDQLITYDRGDEVMRRMLHLSFVADRPSRLDVYRSPAAGTYVLDVLPGVPS